MKGKEIIITSAAQRSESFRPSVGSDRALRTHCVLIAGVLLAQKGRQRNASTSNKKRNVLREWPVRTFHWFSLIKIRRSRLLSFGYCRPNGFRRKDFSVDFNPKPKEIHCRKTDCYDTATSLGGACSDSVPFFPRSSNGYMRNRVSCIFIIVPLFSDRGSHRRNLYQKFRLSRKRNSCSHYSNYQPLSTIRVSRLKNFAHF